MGVSRVLRRAIEVQGHRGAGNLAPHNSMAAFEKARDLGLDSVEFDVWHLLCGTLVVAHGKEVLEEGEKGICQFTFNEFRAEMPHEPHSNFLDVIKICKSSNMAMNIEIKGKDITTVDKVVELLRQHDALHISSISSFSREILTRVMEVEAGLAVGALYDPWEVYSSPTQEAKASILDVDFATWFRCPIKHSPEHCGDTVNLSAEAVTAEQVAEARATGKHVLAWFPMEPQKAGFSECEGEYQRLIDIGVTKICANEPSKLIGFLDKSGQR